MHNYLEEGKQTAITDEVKKIAQNLADQNQFISVFKILDWLNKNVSLNTESKTKLFRHRTGSQIIADKYATGCTDFTLAFIVIARALGIPAKYVEMLSLDWLRGDRENIVGHVISEVQINARWYYVDSQFGTVGVKKPSGMTIFNKGLDSWDIGITHANWQEKFSEFKKNYVIKI